MISPKTSLEDAIHVYKLTLSYLYDARVGSKTSEQDLHAAEIMEGQFHIWRQLPRTSNERVTVPEAVCTYLPEKKIWRVELSSGGKLNLLDTGDVWDILRKDDRRLRAAPKRPRAQKS